MQFNWLTSSGPVRRNFYDSFVAPSGRFVADLENGPLTVYRSHDGGDGNSVAAATEPGKECPKFLTWAKGRERMACVADVPPAQGKLHSEIRIFDLDSANNLTMAKVVDSCDKDVGAVTATSSCSATEYDYTETSADKQPRIFSASGNWLAFTTASSEPATSYLYWIDISATTPSPFKFRQRDAVGIVGANSTSPTFIAFSPDEHYILQQVGGLLAVHALGAVPIVLPYFDPGAAQPAACSEDFASAPDRWCGAENPAARFKWAPDSKIAAFRSTEPISAKAALTVVNPSAAFDFHTFFATDCADKCSAQFSFQPQQ